MFFESLFLLQSYDFSAYIIKGELSFKLKNVSFDWRL
jgi:hypothetical protein